MPSCSTTSQARCGRARCSMRRGCRSRRSRRRIVRAEPIAALYEQSRIKHAGAMPALEDELVAFTTEGYLGDGSPDRADAMIWALTELMLRESVMEPWFAQARAAGFHL